MNILKLQFQFFMKHHSSSINTQALIDDFMIIVPFFSGSFLPSRPQISIMGAFSKTMIINWSIVQVVILIDVVLTNSVKDGKFFYVTYPAY